MKQRHHITAFNLIGYSGGGTVSVLLAARRDDVISLRTVAGNLDHKLQSHIHKVSMMPYSLNAKDSAQDISDIPQIHFVGAQDKIVPIDIAESYKKSARSHCIKNKIVSNVKHHKGWTENWLTLLNEPLPTCS